LLKAAAILSGTALFALIASYLMTRASNRSAAWNVGAAGAAVLILAVLLLITTVVLVRLAFG
jgi:hypothetical protein